MVGDLVTRQQAGVDTYEFSSIYTFQLNDSDESEEDKPIVIPDGDSSTKKSGPSDINKTINYLSLIDVF